MISVPSRLSIRVFIKDCVVASAFSSSLGMIVTELDINGLKFALPDECRVQSAAR